MNPFAAESQFDPRLYEIISKIGKKSNKTKLRGLEELESVLDTIDVEENIGSLVDAIAETISSQDTQLKNRSVDILYELLSRTEDKSEFKRILSIWLYEFVGNPTYGVSKKIFTEFVNLQDFEDEFVKLLDFEKDPVLGLRCLLLLIKKGRNDYSEVFLDSIGGLKLNSVAELTEVYRICKLVGGSDELCRRVSAVTGPSLMNIKWKILLEIFETTPECIVEDGKYLNPEVLAGAIENREYCDEIKVRNVDNLRVIFPKLRDGGGYLKEYLRSRPIGDLCIFELCDDLKFLDENVDFDTVNRLVENVLEKHFRDKEEINERISRLSVRNDFEAFKGSEKEKDVPKHNCSSATQKDKETVFKALLSSLNELCGGKKIVRGKILGAKLNPTDFTVQEIEDVFPYSVGVFPKEYMLANSFSCDQLPLILEYPDEAGESRIKEVINRDNLRFFIPVCKDMDLLRSLIFVHDNNTLLSIYSSCNIPSALDIDFYYRLRDRISKPEMIDYGRLVEEYLDGKFLEDLVMDGVISRSLLYDAVLRHISLLPLSISTCYTHPFYDLDECFYKDVKIKESNPTVLELRKIYLEIYSEPWEIFMLLLLDAMCGDENDTLDLSLRSRGVGGKDDLVNILSMKKELVAELRKIDLKKNQHFVEKIFFDLGLSSRRCGDKPLEELLMDGGLRSIDYILRNWRVPPQFLPFVDFSYLSNKALATAVNILSLAFGNEAFVDFTEISSRWHFTDSSKDVETDAISCLVDDDDFLRSLISSNFRNLRGLELGGLVKIIEKDQLLFRKEFHRERYGIYSGLLESVYRKAADSIFNMYSISRLDLDSVDDEVYELLKGCLFGSNLLFWDLLLNSLLLIRNISVNSFFERMVEKKEEWALFLGSATIEQKSLFAFIFSNIFSTLPRMEISMDPFIAKEASKHVMGIVAKMQKLTNGFNIKISYTTNDTLFTALIFVPLEYPYKKPVFSSDMGKKSLLNLKINEMIQKNSKFMELISLWKVNIDEKISGHKECPICYFILDVHDSSFPTSQCATCKNKFHTRCIVKWVANGVRNSCPICRRPIGPG